MIFEEWNDREKIFAFGFSYQHVDYLLSGDFYRKFLSLYGFDRIIGRNAYCTLRSDYDWNIGIQIPEMGI